MDQVKKLNSKLRLAALAAFLFALPAFADDKPDESEDVPPPIAQGIDPDAEPSLKIKPKHPPEIYISKGICPSQCCHYGRWRALEDTKLYDEPEGTRVVAIVRKGERPTAITGEIHSEPVKVEVIHEHQHYKVGDVFYILSPLGEGFYEIWQNGDVYRSKEEMEDLLKYPRFQSCEKEPWHGCWAKVTPGPLKKAPVWWVQIKTTEKRIKKVKKGRKIKEETINVERTGWTKELKNFHPPDRFSCS